MKEELGPLKVILVSSPPMDGNRETFSVSELDAAATKLQKVCKGYRTRRNLAEAAVVVEELWWKARWKAVDFAALKQGSISFFNSEENETAVSRWTWSRTRAAKIGKGLCKDEKAQILAPQYWLEAIDLYCNGVETICSYTAKSGRIAFLAALFSSFCSSLPLSCTGYIVWRMDGIGSFFS